MSFETIRVLIWGKTYPELSKKYVETVCTGGVRDDGSPIRLYPVPLRYLDGSKQYSLYDWIEVPVEKSTTDPRRESFKVMSDKIRVVGHLETRDNWRARREAIFQNSSWQFDSVSALKARQQDDGCSMGIVTPGSVEGARLEAKPGREAAEYTRKWTDLQAQKDLFHPQYRELEYLPNRVRLKWRCLGACTECVGSPHDMSVLDWGLLELARRDGWSTAVDRLRVITDKGTHDFKIFMGNFRLHLHIFGIIGLWYPKLSSQIDLI